MDSIEKLSKYGTIKICKLVHEKVAIIVLTKDFNENAIKTFEFLKECAECFPDHPFLETCITESHFAMVILLAH